MNLRPIVLAALAVLVGESAAAAPPADGGAPAGLREEVVLAGVVIGRSRLHLSRFADPRPPESVLEAVAAAWVDRPAPMRREARDGWLVLVQAVEDAVEVLEVRATARGSTEGRRSRWESAGPGSHSSAASAADPGIAAAAGSRALSATDPGAATPGAWLEDILPAGSQVLQRLTHRDGGRQTTTLVALTATGSSAAARQLAAALERAGFARKAGMPAAYRARGEAFFLQRRREEVAVTVSELDGRRAVVLHWGVPYP